MLLSDVAARRAVFVGGKGGVGKTSIASAIALARARRGARVLVVSTDPAHNLGHLWQREIGDGIVTLWRADERGRVRSDGAGAVNESSPGGGGSVSGAGASDRHAVADGMSPTAGADGRRDPDSGVDAVDRGENAPSGGRGSAGVTGDDGSDPGRVDGVEVDPARTADAHLHAVWLTMRRLLPERLHRAAREHLESARDAPGTHESAVLERVAETLETGLDRYDLVVFDTAPSGHTLHLLAMPERMTGWTERLLANRDRSERYSVAYGALGGTKDTSDRDAELRRMLLARRARFSLMRDTLRDARRTGFVLVFVPEPMPIAESREVAAQLDGLGVDLIGAVANRLSPADAMPARRAREEALLDGLDLAAPVTRIPLVDELIGFPALTRLADALTTR